MTSLYAVSALSVPAFENVTAYRFAGLKDRCYGGECIDLLYMKYIARLVFSTIVNGGRSSVLLWGKKLFLKMGKLNVSLIRYMSKEDFRILTAVSYAYMYYFSRIERV